MTEFKHTCPGCKGGFDKSIRDDSKDVCCPHCKAKLLWRQAKDDDGVFRRGYILRHILRTRDAVAPNLELVSEKNQSPFIYKATGVDYDYRVVYENIIPAQRLYCPHCGKIIGQNQFSYAPYGIVLQCKNTIDPKRNKGEKGRCKMKTEFIMK